MASGWCLDCPSAPLRLVVRAVVRLGLDFDPQLVGARLAGERPLEGWERLDGQTGQRETRQAEAFQHFISQSPELFVLQEPHWAAPADTFGSLLLISVTACCPAHA